MTLSQLIGILKQNTASNPFYQSGDNPDESIDNRYISQREIITNHETTGDRIQREVSVQVYRATGLGRKGST